MNTVNAQLELQVLFFHLLHSNSFFNTRTPNKSPSGLMAGQLSGRSHSTSALNTDTSPCISSLLLSPPLSILLDRTSERCYACVAYSPPRTKLPNSQGGQLHSKWGALFVVRCSRAHLCQQYFILNHVVSPAAHLLARTRHWLSIASHN